MAAWGDMPPSTGCLLSGAWLPSHLQMPSRRLRIAWRVQMVLLILAPCHLTASSPRQEERRQRGLGRSPLAGPVLLRLTADSSHWMSSLETQSNPIPGPLISCHGKATLHHPRMMQHLCLFYAEDSPPLQAAPVGGIEADPGPALYGCPQTSSLRLTPKWSLYG